jgi:hypothetical protein
VFLPQKLFEQQSQELQRESRIGALLVLLAVAVAVAAASPS